MKKHRSKFPKFGDWLLRLFARYDVNPHLRGDFDEEFSFIYETKGYGRAWFWYWTHLLRSLPVFIKDILYWRVTMIKNYLKIALRNFQRHKGYSFINIGGLAVGLACCLLIILYIQYELSFDKLNINAGRIFKVYTHLSAYNPSPLTPAIRNEIPAVESITHLNPDYDVLISADENVFVEERWLWTDKYFFSIFTLPFIHGNPKTALENPYSIVIDEETSNKYFGEKNPVGKTITRDNEDDYQITGVIKNIPANSHIKGHLFAAMETLKIMGSEMNDWRNQWVHTYVLLKNGSTGSELQEKANAIYRRNTGGQNALTVRKLTDVHLRSSDTRSPLEPGSDIKYIYLLSAIAFVILLIACINYINLSTAGSLSRSREIGIRKTAGAVRSQLIRQFLGESLFMTLIAIMIAVAVAALFLERFAQFAGRDISSNALFNLNFLTALLGIGVFTGLLSGGYPALHLSRFKPVTALKGTYSQSTKGRFLRNLLVIFQFSLSISLIIIALVVTRQNEFIRNKKLGFNREHVIVVDVQNNKEVKRNYLNLKNELLRNPGIAGVTCSTTLPMNIYWGNAIDFEGRQEEEKIVMSFTYVDYDYIDVFGLELSAGRNFSPRIRSDITGGGAYILNETAVKQIGWDDPIGKKFRLSHQKDMGKVVGVIRNFHNRPLHYAQDPVVLWLNFTSNIRLISFKIHPGNIRERIKDIEKVWKNFSGGWPFDYKFMDNEYDRMYRSEMQLGTIFRFFSILAIVLSCLGLFGLTLFTTKQRTKEIGIRKVLGASVPSILSLLSKGFLKWVIIANIISWPIAYYFMNKWLQNFSYHTTLSIWIFLLSGFAALVIALLTVSYQTIKAATSNPVDSLRYE
jgi:putative ABC transport system permease protein